MSTESFNLLPFQASATTAIVEAIGKYKAIIDIVAAPSLCMVML